MRSVERFPEKLEAGWRAGRLHLTSTLSRPPFGKVGQPIASRAA